MSVFMVIVAKIHDRAGMRDYIKATAALTEKHGGRYILRASHAVLLEGDFGEDAGVLLTEWPDVESAQAFWDGADYAPLKEGRAGKADVQVLMVEGQIAHYKPDVGLT